MGSFLQDLRHSVRALRNSPGFSAIAILTLALGIGANTAIFSAINSVLLRPLPFHDPDRLVFLYETELAPGTYPFAGPDYLDWQSQNKTLEGMSLYTWTGRSNVSGAGEPQSVAMVQTQANFFSVLGIQPYLGRSFAVGEDQDGKDRVAIVSHGFWMRNFGGDSDVLGKSLELNAEKYTIVGVMPRSFNYPSGTEIWTPLSMSEKNLGPRGSHSYRALGRLKPGVTISQAQADLAVIARRLEQQYPDSNEKVGAAVFAMREQVTQSSREQLLILQGVVVLVLLVACANVANLLLARSVGRQREIAMRLALGVGRWRLVRQLLSESLLISLIGAGIGLATAWWLTGIMRNATSLPIPRLNPVKIDATVLLFTAGLSVVVAVVFGAAPAFQASRLNLSDELKSAGQAVLGSSGFRRRIRDVLVVAEIAVSLSLLVGAGLLMRSFLKMRNADIGIQPKNIMTARINLPEKRYSTISARREFLDRLIGRIQSSPGISAASLSTVIPLEGGNNGYITVPGREDAALKNQLFEWNYVTPDYFKVFGISFLQGRNFNPHELDNACDVSRKLAQIYSAPNPPKEVPSGLSVVAVINLSMARLVWPGQDPIGKIFKAGGDLPVSVVGVVTDVKEWGIREDVLPQAYYPMPFALDYRHSWQILAKTAVPPRSALGAIRSCVGALDTGLAVIDPRTMEEVIAESMIDTSLQTLLLGVFAVLAALIASVGLYSVLSFIVSHRRREIGIRMALGAGRRQVQLLVLGHGARLIAAGMILGLGIAIWLTKLMRGLLFGVAAGDLPTFAGVSGLLALVGLLACYMPARRASRVDPIVALRYD